MANERLPMRQIREVLRLKYGCGLSLSNRDIGTSCGIGKSAVTKYLGRARLAGLSWPLPEGLGDEELERRLFPPLATPAADRPPPPDFQYVYDELRRHKKVNLTLDLLWREYLEAHPDGYRYAYYCKLYGRWRRKLDYVMRQEHKAGEKLFVDYTDGLYVIENINGIAVQNANLGYEIGRTLEQIAELSRSIRVLSDYLERHPEALLRGKSPAKGE